jgi:acyl carrier protein
MTNEQGLAEIQERVIQVVSQVLRLDAGEVANLRTLSGYKKLVKWTSARHAEIIVAVEDEFAIEVEERAIPRLIDVASIAAYVHQRRQ